MIAGRRTAGLVVSILALGSVSWQVGAHPLGAQTFSHYLTAQVGITARPALKGQTADVQSAGVAHVRDWHGNIDFSWQVNGDHYIYESGSGTTEPIVAANVIATLGEYNASLRTGADPGQCYRARLEASSPIVEEPIERGSAEQCFEDSCPILLDLDRDGFHLVGTEHGVDFDLDADGSAERLGWTTAGALDGFLCRDRNQNGTIDDGRELFGTATPLEGGGTADNGYLALAELDLPAQGGNGDGLVSRADALFHELCVWFDLDHDGRAGAGEVSSLPDLGVLELVLDYKTSWRRDRFGNLFRFGSSGSLALPEADVRIQSYDVFFATRSPEHDPD